MTGAKGRSRAGGGRRSTLQCVSKEPLPRVHRGHVDDEDLQRCAKRAGTAAGWRAIDSDFLLVPVDVLRRCKLLTTPVRQAPLTSTHRYVLETFIDESGTSFPRLVGRSESSLSLEPDDNT